MLSVAKKVNSSRWPTAAILDLAIASICVIREIRIDKHPSSATRLDDLGRVDYLLLSNHSV